MEKELDALERRVSDLARALHDLRAENRVIREALAAKTAENQRLLDQINAARSRLESVLQQLPE